MFTKNQITLQTFLANGLVPKSAISFATSIANARNATQKQRVYIDKIVNDIVNKPEAPKSNFDATKIFTLFENAVKKLRYPKINLKTNGNRPLRLNTSRKYPDTVFLGSGGFGTETYGKLVKGEAIRWYTKDSDIQRDVEEMVKAFAADPVAVSAAYGKLNHHCAYCSKALDTPESLAVGYGPVCAKHFDLPWGKYVPRTKPNVKELVDLGVNVSNAAMALDSEMNELLTDE